jgi:hypothetical protein
MLLVGCASHSSPDIAQRLIQIAQYVFETLTTHRDHHLL